ncbi:MAG: M16 family metallopeptidase [Candidatus Hinthialibacter sp.]
MKPMINANGNPLLPYTEHRLPCGMTLVHKKIRSAPIVAIDIWVHTGAIHDPDPAFGLSHFYEHMFFKGTERHGVGEMDRIITSLGGYNNAATSLDYTHYYVVLPAAGWKQALDVLLDSLCNPLFDPKEIERERAVIVEEIKRHEDNPWSKIYEEFTQAAFAHCPYRRSVLGAEESLNAIRQETFFDYHQNRYRLDNITLCVVGDVSLCDVKDACHEFLGDQSASSATEIPMNWELIQAPQEVKIQRDVNQAYLLIGYPTPGLYGAIDEYTLDLLSIIIGEGRSSRLHQRLHDELGLVSSISCTSWILKYAGLFLIEAVTEDDKLNRVENEIQGELNRIRDSLTADELEKAKSITRADYAFSNEKMISIAHTYGYSRVVVDIDHAIHYLERIEDITLEQIQESYDRLLVPPRRCRGLLIPK